MDVSGIWERVKEKYGFTEEPTGRKRSRMIEETACLATEGAGKTQREIGKYFEVDQAAISQGMKRLRARWREDGSEKKKFLKWVRGLK